MPVDYRAMLRAYGAEIEGNRNPKRDVRTGSCTDVWGGTSALILSRLALNEDEMFNDISIDTAKARFREIAEIRFGETPRVEDRGTGIVLIGRASNAAGGGTFLPGTTLKVTVGGSSWNVVTTAETVVSTETELSLAVRAATVASGFSGDAAGSVLDAIWDPSWRVSYALLSDGRAAETNREFLARIKNRREISRPGYPRRIKDACREVGAVEVALFEDSFAYSDFGLSHCYVSDGDGEASEALVNRCRVAVDSAAVGGCDLWVGAMTAQRVNVRATIRLWGSLNDVNANEVKARAAEAVRSYFEARETAFVFEETAISGAIQSRVSGTQDVIVTTDPVSPNVQEMFSQEPLPQYYVGGLYIRVEGV